MDLAPSPAKAVTAATCRGCHCRDLTLITSKHRDANLLGGRERIARDARGRVRRAVDRGGRAEGDRRRSRRRALGTVARKLARPGSAVRFGGLVMGPLADALRRPQDRDLRRRVDLHRALDFDASASSGSSISATACSSGCSAPPASMRRSMSMSATGSTAAAARRSRCFRAGSISPARSGRRSSSAPSPTSAGSTTMVAYGRVRSSW